MAKEGADVAVMDIDLANAKRVAKGINKIGQKGLALKVDVANFTDVVAAAGKIKAEFGHIDILVSTASIPNKYIPLSQITEEEWDRSLALNLKCKGIFNATRGLSQIHHLIYKYFFEAIMKAILSFIIVNKKNYQPFFSP